MNEINTIEDAKAYISCFSFQHNKTEEQNSGFSNLLKCEEIALQQNDKALLIRCRILLTEYYVYINDLQSALNLALINKQMAVTENLKEEELSCYSGLLRIYYLLGDYGTLEELIHAYRNKLLDSNDNKRLCSLYIFSAIQYHTLKDYKKCIEANNKALEYALKINNPVMLIHVYNNFGYHAIDYDLKLAHELLTKCIDLSKSSGESFNLAPANVNLAEVYFKIKDYKSSNKCLDTAIKHIKSDNNNNYLLEAQNRLSELFIHTEKFTAAENLLKQIEKKCLSTNNKSILLTSYKHFYILNEKIKKYKPAYEYLLKYQELKEELFNEESNQKIRNLQIANEVNSIKRQRDHAEHIAHLKHDFLANMSHEIRTPINSVLGICYLMQQENLTSKQQNYIHRLERSGENLLGLINEILDISKIEAGKLELVQAPFSFNTVLSDTLQSLQQKADEKGIRLLSKTTRELDQMIAGDALRLSQILLNLVSNAIKFTSKGKVTVTASIEQNKNNELLISCCIKDTGSGIPQDRIQAIFERYEQASALIKTEFGGTGLGLAITKKIIELMNGTLSVESTLNKGSSFKIEIPFRKSENTISTEAVIKKDTSFLQGLKIIVADDIEENRAVAKDVLLHFNPTLRIFEAENGKEVLLILEKNIPDVILLDLDMPEMNGMETISEIRKNNKFEDVIVIANTAGLLTLTKEEILEMGFDELLVKPFKPVDLLQKLSLLVQ